MKIPIEIFKTNISNKRAAGKILKELKENFPGSSINFDLDDCDKILRMEGEDFEVDKTVEVVNKAGYHCEILE